VTSRDEWMRRLGPLYGGAVALVHSTPWPWPRAVIDSVSTNEARSPFWVVAIGAPIGLVAYLAAVLLRGVGLPVPIAALLGLAVLTLASAALVERGVVDRIDGKTAGALPAPPSTLATLVLVFTTLVRAGCVLYVRPDAWLGVFLATALVGRWAAVFLQGLGDPILDDDAPRSLVVVPPPLWLTGALTIGVAVVVGFALGKAGIFALVLGAAAAFALGLDAQRRDKGLSSPVVALAAAIAELMLLLAATI
jgi:hypothetical protein